MFDANLFRRVSESSEASFDQSCSLAGGHADQCFPQAKHICPGPEAIAGGDV